MSAFRPTHNGYRPLLDSISQGFKESPGLPEVRYEVATNVQEDLALLGVRGEIVRGIGAFEVLQPLGDLGFGGVLDYGNLNHYQWRDNGMNPKGVYVQGRGITHQFVPLKIQESDNTYTDTVVHAYFKGVGSYHYAIPVLSKDISRYFAAVSTAHGIYGLPATNKAEQIMFEGVYGRTLTQKYNRVRGLSFYDETILEYALGVALLAEITNMPEMAELSLAQIITLGVPFPFSVAKLAGMENYINQLVEHSELDKSSKDWFLSQNYEYGVLGSNAPATKRVNQEYSRCGSMDFASSMGRTLRLLYTYGLAYQHGSSHSQNYYAWGYYLHADLGDTVNFIYRRPSQGNEYIRGDVMNCLDGTITGSLKNSKNDWVHTFYSALTGGTSTCPTNDVLYKLFDREKAERFVSNAFLIAEKYGQSQSCQGYIMDSLLD